MQDFTHMNFFRTCSILKYEERVGQIQKWKEGREIGQKRGRKERTGRHRDQGRREGKKMWTHIFSLQALH